MTQALKYTAYTSESSGTTFDFAGSIDGAIEAATAYAKEAFPARGYEGYGPTIVIADAATGERLVEQRL